PRVSVSGQWTIALWVQWNDGPNTYEHPIQLGTGHHATYWSSVTTFALTTQDASGTTVVDRRLSSSITTGIWYHLAATFDGTTVKGYLDGVQAFSVPGPATTIRSSSVKIGTSGSQVGNFFSGIIDEVLIYNRALTASEIAALTPNVPFARLNLSQMVAQGTGVRLSTRDLSTPEEHRHGLYEHSHQGAAGIVSCTMTTKAVTGQSDSPN